MSDETQEHPSLAGALVAAQAEMPAVPPDGENPHFGSKFVTLGKLIASVRPVLNRHGLAMVQLPAQDEQGRPVLTTRIIHAGGESLEATMPLMLAKQDPQALGSALTYAKRYALAAALGISDQDDDDGNATRPEAAPPIPADALLDSAKDAGLEFAQIHNWLGANEVEAPEFESDDDARQALDRLDPDGRRRFAASCQAFKAKRIAKAREASLAADAEQAA